MLWSHFLFPDRSTLSKKSEDHHDEYAYRNSSPAPLAPAFGKDPDYEPLWLYKGAWKGTRKEGNAAPVTNTIKNDGALAGRFFVCQQTVNEKPGALIIFVPAGSPGSYYTQAVMQEGFATGRGELRIEGDRWTYSSKAERNGKTTYHRTTNVFTGKNRPFRTIGIR